MEPTGVRILVADDSDTVRAYVSGLLRDEGCDVHEATDGRIALDLCRIVRPDLLILDLEMPRLDGKQLLARLRADRKVSATPVLVLTADERESTVMGALDAGASDFVVKPPRPAELLARVRRLLREKAGVDDLVERSRALAEAAEIDALTGLPNRRASAGALAIATARAREANRPLAVAMIDIDRFKLINDTYGHAAGDQVLCAIAGRLGDQLRPGDTVGRWGGEEFIAVLDGAGPVDAARAAESLRAASSSGAVSLGSEPLVVTVSVGWASSATTSPDVLLELADAALYQAKASGRNCVRAADPLAA